MAIKVMADSGGTITYTASEIGGAFNSFAGGSDYILGGISSEMAVTTSASSLEISIGSGRAVVCGRVVNSDAVEKLTINPSEVNGVYVVLRIDTTRPIGTEGYFTYCTEAQLKEENINNANGQHDLILGIVKTDSLGVTSFTDQRNVTDDAGGGFASGKIKIYEDGTALPTPVKFRFVLRKEETS